MFSYSPAKKNLLETNSTRIYMFYTANIKSAGDSPQIIRILLKKATSKTACLYE